LNKKGDSDDEIFGSRGFGRINRNARVRTDAGLRSYAASDSQKAKAKKKKVVTTSTQARRASPYSTNPEYDVYVRGEYVGSDPDPRIRSTLRDEAKRHYGIRN
jgi:hypothetical protein